MDVPTTGDVSATEAASARDWSELPLAALASVFGKLGALEILMGAGLVCHTWLEAAKVPELWRSVFMVKPKINLDALCAMAKVAVDRSAGQLKYFAGEQFVTDELLKYICDRSLSLKAVLLVSCERVSNDGFSKLVAKCPQLEELALAFCENVCGRDVYEATGRACPRLKRLALNKSPAVSLLQLYTREDLGREALGVAALHGLRSLSLIGCDVTNDELAFVLGSCSHLEILNLRDCFQLVVDDALRARCAGIKSLSLPRARGLNP